MLKGRPQKITVSEALAGFYQSRARLEAARRVVADRKDELREAELTLSDVLSDSVTGRMCLKVDFKALRAMMAEGTDFLSDD